MSYVPKRPCMQVVHADHAVALCERPLAEVTSDKPRSDDSYVSGTNDSYVKCFSQNLLPLIFTIGLLIPA